MPHPDYPRNPGSCSPSRRAAAWDGRARCRRSLRSSSPSAGHPAGEGHGRQPAQAGALAGSERYQQRASPAPARPAPIRW